MKKKIFDTLLILIISFFFLEISSLILIKLNFLPNGLTPRITLVPNENFGYWHHKNKKFKLASECWSSKVTYNNYGMRQINNVNLKKNKKRIGIIGDSMTENLEVIDGKDFFNLLQKKLINYELLNFSTRSLGLGDQIELYNNLAKKFKLDYIFLFVSDNDFEDNYIINKNRPTQIRYEIIDNKVKKIIKKKSISKKNFFKKTKNKYFLYIKQYFNSYILYFHTKNYIMYHLQKNNKNKILQKKYIDKTEEKKIVYRFMIDKFYKNLSNNEKLYIFINPRPKIIRQEKSAEKNNIKYMTELWGLDKVIDPTKSGINFLKSINKYEYPYFSFTCDGHYSELGAKFMSSYVSNHFLNN